MKLIFTDKASDVDLEKLMDIYEESNWENLSMAKSIIGRNSDKFDKNYLYQVVRKSHKAYISDDFLKNHRNKLAVLIDEGEYLSALRLFYKGEYYLLEALETNPKYRRSGYGERLVREVIKLLDEGSVIKSEVAISNEKSLKLHKKVGFKLEKIEKNHCHLIFKISWN